MADNDDVPIGPAGRDYYARQFGGRLQEIRKNAPAPRPYASSYRPGAGCIARLVIAGVVGVIALIANIVSAVSHSSSSSSSSPSYSTPSYTPPPTYKPATDPAVAPGKGWDGKGGGLDKSKKPTEQPAGPGKPQPPSKPEAPKPGEGPTPPVGGPTK